MTSTSTSRMSPQVYYTTIKGPELTDSVIAQAATLFSNHYGQWSSHSTSTGSTSSPKKGRRVLMSPSFLRQTCLPPLSQPQLTRAIDSKTNTSIGHAITSHWPSDLSDFESERDTVCWITQLVVHTSWRRRGIATALLRHVKREIEQKRYRIQPHPQPQQEDCASSSSYPGDVIFGVLSSHPATIRAFCTVFGRGIGAVDFSDTRALAKKVVETLPVGFVRECTITGSLFDDDGNDGGGEGSRVAKASNKKSGAGGVADESQADAADDADRVICCANTGFFVDSAEARREVLAELKDKGVKWPFGDLPPGHEYLVLFRDQVKVFI